MPEANRTLAYAGESIPFHLSYSKRKTLEIAVHPDCSVVVKAPLGADETFVEDFIHKRATLDKTPDSLFRGVCTAHSQAAVCRRRKPSLPRQTVSAEDKAGCTRTKFC